jgi:hypothetical protein
MLLGCESLQAVIISAPRIAASLVGVELAQWHIMDMAWPSL